MIGQRVQNSETRERATVLFSGEIKSQQFVGVCYDNPVGKYDGEYQGTRYFTCQPNHGAFLKGKKLYNCLEAAITEKYVTERQAETIMQLTDGQMTKNIELKGLQQIDSLQANIKQLQSVSVKNCGFIDSFENLSKMIPNCDFLDLSGNPVESDAILLYYYLPSVHVLDLSGNDLLISERDVGFLLSKRIDKSCSLFVNEARGDVVKSLNMLFALPFITEYLANNIQFDIMQLRQSATLRSLQLNYAVEPQKMQFFEAFLSRYPNLEQLALAGCISDEGDTFQAAYTTGKLQVLNLAKCTLSIHCLMQLHSIAPCVRNLKLTKISGVESDDALASICCGLFSESIQFFNAGEVKKRQIIDYQTYLCNYLLKLESYQIRDDLVLRLLRERQIPVRVGKCQQLTEEQKNGLYVIEDNDESNKESEGALIKKQFNGRVIKVKYGQQHFMASVITPIWQFVKLLDEKSISAVYVVSGERTERLAGINKYTELLDVVQDYVCEIM